MASFIDLFAGCGGIRLAFEQAGHKCVWGCEWDKFARHTYAANFGREPEGCDIRDVRSEDVPDFDCLTGGFPCQPFSPLGHGKGFQDERGLLYLHILRLLRDKKPRCFFLENVPGLVRSGCINQIQQDIQAIGYTFDWRIINASLVWPQSRKRCYMIGYLDGKQHQWPDIGQQYVDVQALLQAEGDFQRITQRRWDFLDTRKKSGQTGNYAWRLLDGHLCPTLCTGADNIFVPMKDGLPRYLTVRERARIQGFPDSFVFPVSKTQAVKQIGNAVTVPLVRRLAASISVFESSAIPSEMFHPGQTR